MVNYLEFGKNWEDAAREGYEDEMPSGWDSDRYEVLVNTAKYHKKF